jgi:hypothetical protein
MSSAMSQSTTPGPATMVAGIAHTTSSITLQWQPPNVTTGSPVTGYKVYERKTHEFSDLFSPTAANAAINHFFTGDASDLQIDTLVVDGSNSASTVANVSGLSGGRAYAFVLGMLSAAGEGNRTQVSNHSTCPPAPTSLTAVATSTTTVILRWSAPVVTTGVPTTGYQVLRNDGVGGPVDVVACDGTGLVETNCTASGLLGGHFYEFKVVALSANGASDASQTLTVHTAAAAVASIASSLQTSTSITLSWAAPVFRNGLSATGYRVYRNDGSGGSAHDILAYDGSASVATNAVVSGLQGGRMYSFVVSALSTAGHGDIGHAILRSTAPAAPTSLIRVSNTPTSVSLQWSAAAESGGSATQYYKLYRSNGASGATSVLVYNGTATTANVPALLPGTAYKFAVAGVSAAGVGDLSQLASACTAAGAPANFVNVAQTASTVHLRWQPTSVSACGVDLGYVIYRDDGLGGSSVVAYNQSSNAATSATISGLTNGRTYQFQISALGSHGEGVRSSLLNVSTAPKVPTSLVYKAFATQWQALLRTFHLVQLTSALRGSRCRRAPWQAACDERRKLFRSQCCWSQCCWSLCSWSLCCWSQWGQCW